MSDLATVAATPDVARVTPTVSQPIRVDWASWAEQFLAHETPMIEAGVNAGLQLAEGQIPGGAFIKLFVGEKVVDQYVDQGIKVLGGILEKAPTITTDGTHPIAAYVANMVNSTAPKLAAALGPKLDDLIKAGMAKGGITI